MKATRIQQKLLADQKDIAGGITRALCALSEVRVNAEICFDGRTQNFETLGQFEKKD